MLGGHSRARLEHGASLTTEKAEVATVMTHLREPRRKQRWLRRIRADPRKLVVYRCGIGLLGLLCVLLGLLTGPFPGPGGIPLMLIGVAVWSSEFRWAHRLLLRVKEGVRRYRSWSRRRQVAVLLMILLICGVTFYGGLLIAGPPTWLPGWAHGFLVGLPGIQSGGIFE